MSTIKSQGLVMFAVGAIAGIAGSYVTLNLMHSKSPVQTSALQTSAAPTSAAPTSAAAPTGAAAPQTNPASPNAPALQESTGVFVNQKELSAEQMQDLLRLYGSAPPKGRYWYDQRSGLFGYWGYESAGYIRPGHNFGELSPRASNGDTGAFLNGREINMTEARYFQSIFGVAYQGRFWLDGATGNMGIEGNPTPLANLILAVRQAQQRGQNGGYHWRDGSGSVVSSEGNCTFAAIPGAPVYSTPGCG